MLQAVCVLCQRHPVDPAWRPFCSERCRLQDLARWVDGTYRVATQIVNEPDDTENRGLEGEQDEASVRLFPNHSRAR